MLMPIGILGGTFDPIHIGHLRIALDLRDALQLDHVRLLPCAVPPHRGQPVASMEMRSLMVVQSLDGEPGLVLDDRESDRDGPSYTVDTLTELRAEFPDQALCLILGTDGFAGLDRWNRWEQILDLAHIIVAKRPGAELPTAGPVAELLQTKRLHDRAGLTAQPNGGILVTDVTQLDVSASKIRELLASGHSARYLVPENALHLIDRYRLYQ